MASRIKDFLYDFLKDVNKERTAIYCIESRDLYDHYTKYCDEKSSSTVSSSNVSSSNVDVKSIMSFASTLGKYNIDGASRKNKSWPGGKKAATWFFDVAKVKTALDPTNVSSMSVTSTPTTTPPTIVTSTPTTIPPTIVTAAPTAQTPTVQAVTPIVATPVQPVVVNLIDDDESEPESKKMKKEDEKEKDDKHCMMCSHQIKGWAKYCSKCGCKQ